MRFTVQTETSECGLRVNTKIFHPLVDISSRLFNMDGCPDRKSGLGAMLEWFKTQLTITRSLVEAWALLDIDSPKNQDAIDCLQASVDGYLDLCRANVLECQMDLYDHGESHISFTPWDLDVYPPVMDAILTGKLP